MKHCLTITIMATCVMMAAVRPIHAAQQCVADVQSMTNCGPSTTGQQTQVDWFGKCNLTANGQTVTFQGIGVCSNVMGNSQYATSTALSVDTDNPSANTYCWCKLTKPFETLWMYFYYSSADCQKNCPGACGRIYDSSVLNAYYQPSVRY